MKLLQNPYSTAAIQVGSGSYKREPKNDSHKKNFEKEDPAFIAAENSFKPSFKHVFFQSIPIWYKSATVFLLWLQD